MKIAIVGFSGSGKSTLAQKLGQKYAVPVLHLDAVHHLSGWRERDSTSEQAMAKAFLDAHSGWVIDGNYASLSYQRRMAEADCIVQLLFPPLSCLWRVVRRYLRYRGKRRPDMAEGCTEKLDRTFIKWVLWGGRSEKALRRYANVQAQYPDKTVVIRNQRQLNCFMAGQELHGQQAKAGKERP